MAVIKNHESHSTIQIRKDIYFVFGNLEYDGTDIEKLKFSIKQFNRYFDVLGEEKPIFKMNWKNGREGDWVVSDDMRIIQILKYTPSEDPSNYNKALIRTCVGTFAVNDSTFFDTDFELHPDRYRVSSHKKENYERVISRENLTTNEEQFASRIAKGMQPKDAYMEVFPTKSKRYARDMSNILMRQERVNKKISSEVDQILQQEGVSKQYIIRKYKQLIDEGLMDLKHCSSSVRAALNDLVQISAMNPEENKQTAQGALHSIGDDEILAIEEAEEKAHKRLKAPERPQTHEVVQFEENDEEFVSEMGRSLLS